jgi:hypothetical protein
MHVTSIKIILIGYLCKNKQYLSHTLVDSKNYKVIRSNIAPCNLYVSANSDFKFPYSKEECKAKDAWKQGGRRIWI